MQCPRHESQHAGGVWGPCSGSRGLPSRTEQVWVNTLMALSKESCQVTEPGER